jgi:hypothetical protein
MRLTGLRGVGKTVLLGEFEDVAKDAGWAAGFLELNPRHNADEAFAATMRGLAQRIGADVSRVERLKATLDVPCEPPAPSVSPTTTSR